MFRPRISLKWFLLGTTLIAVFLGTEGKRAYDAWQGRRRVAQQQKIARELRTSHAGVVTRDVAVIQTDLWARTGGDRAISVLKDATELERLTTDGPVSDQELASLEKLVKLRDVGFYEPGPNFTNASLRRIGSLPQLERLTVGRSAITDDGLAHLSGLKQLTSLYIAFSSVRGRGLSHASSIPSLRQVMIVGCPVDDDGLKGLAECRALERLWLDKTKLCGPGLAHLAALPKLKVLRLCGNSLEDGEALGQLDQVEELDLTEAKIAPGVLAQTAKMDRLTHLNLLRTGITDDHLAELQDSTHLTTLVLTYTNITNAGLVHLRHMKGLTTLQLRYTAVTKADAEELSQYLPATDIFYADGKRIPGNPQLRSTENQSQTTP